MSKIDEVELFLKDACRGCDDGMEHAEILEKKCRDLAVEIDELHRQYEITAKGCALENEKKERDATITA